MRCQGMNLGAMLVLGFVIVAKSSGTNQTITQFSSVSLPCSGSRSGYIYRSWHRGHFGQSTSTRYNAGGEELIRQVRGMEPEVLRVARRDMKVDENFTLTIGRASLEDSTEFTCFQALPSRDRTKESVYSYQKVTVEALPEEAHPYLQIPVSTLVAAIAAVVAVLFLVVAASLLLHRLKGSPREDQEQLVMETLDRKMYKRLHRKSQ